MQLFQKCKVTNSIGAYCVKAQYLGPTSQENHYSCSDFPIGSCANGKVVERIHNR
jgi:hypothetical protein